jgi:hypothetical protein
VDLRAGLNAVEKRKTSSPWQELNPGHPTHSPSLYQHRNFKSPSSIGAEDYFNSGIEMQHPSSRIA